jgi:hypothetical protein
VRALEPKVIGYARDTSLTFIYFPPESRFERLNCPDRIVLDEPFHILTAVEPLSASPRTRRVRPLMAGVSIGNAKITAGTLGAFGKYKGETVLVSNAHVFTDKPESPYPPFDHNIIQPGSIDGGFEPLDIVAKYHSHVQVKIADASSCPISKAIAKTLNWLSEALGRQTRFEAVTKPANKVDTALATLSKNIEYSPVVMGNDGSPVAMSGKLAGFLFAGSGDYYVVSKIRNVLSYYPELELINASPVDVKPGDRVIKCGRTTGCTEGEVVSANAVLEVRYPAGLALFEDVVVVRGKSAGGDSGSAVWLL